jgi:hypothetical protein
LATGWVICMIEIVEPPPEPPLLLELPQAVRTSVDRRRRRRERAAAQLGGQPPQVARLQRDDPVGVTSLAAAARRDVAGVGDPHDPGVGVELDEDAVDRAQGLLAHREGVLERRGHRQQLDAGDPRRVACGRLDEVRGLGVHRRRVSSPEDNS